MECGAKRRRQIHAGPAKQRVKQDIRVLQGRLDVALREKGAALKCELTANANEYPWSL